MELDAAVVPVVQHLRDRRCVEIVAEAGEETLARREIQRPPIVRVDEAEVPELGALVDVGHAGHGQLEHGLDQAVQHPRAARCARLERPETVRNGFGRLGVERMADEIEVTPPRRRRPAQPSWSASSPRASTSTSRLRGAAGDRPARRRGRVVLSGEIRRPGGEEQLVEGVLVVAPGRAVPSAPIRAGARIIRLQAATRAAHCSGISDSTAEPRAGVLAALGVVGGGGEHRVRRAPRPLPRWRHERRATLTPKRSGSPPTSFSASSRL